MTKDITLTDITITAITCAVDLTHRSDHALKRAVGLAREKSLWLNVIHVVDHDLPAAIRDRQEKVAWDEIHSAIKRLDPEMAERAKITIKVDDPIPTVLRFVATHERGLLVLGAPRQSEGWNWPFSAHTAGRLLRSAVTPVLVVTNPSDKRYERVLIGVDCSVPSRRAIELALALANQAEFRLLYAWQIPYPALQPGERPKQEYEELSRREITSFFEEEVAKPVEEARAANPGLQMAPTLRMGEPQMALREEAAAFGADLIVLGTHGRKGVTRALLGSVAEDLLSAPPCDVLIAVPN